ncbi:hypothetical protein GJ698_22235 [Pseudoduganella sp. FT26W]|uniref:Uncharacterized protein n=1 Tax=Duganella aquatilis TaxID=2666082 RepID=A0A844D1V0_9BURK|nr:hypothetical protein [Duganella aquatilis]MRW86793.1 hypothetical protein [Duganella aquatilis]
MNLTKKRANGKGWTMAVEIEVGDEVVVEPTGAAQPARQRSTVRSERVAAPAPRDFDARMDNWRRVVNGGSGGADASVCAAWAKWYVALRTSEAPPQSDVYEAKYKPLQPLVSPDVLDGWIVEEAYRKLGDFNDRMALKCRHIYGFDEARIRTKLKGVRGPHVRLVIARAENNLQAILKKLDSRNTIRSTTCLPGCPEPTAEQASP